MIYTRIRKGNGPRIALTRIIIGLVVVVAVGTVLALLFGRNGLGPFPFGISRRDTALMSLWNEQQYRAVLDEAEVILANRPLDSQALTFGGFAHLYVGIDEVDADTRMEHLERSVMLLRKADHLSSAPLDSERNYVLAKAYFHRGHTYLDLAIEYMNRSLEGKYLGGDSYVYLGMAHAGLGEFESGALWYERAIELDETDVLHIKAAESWVAAMRFDVAEQHLRRAIAVSDDEFLALMARNKLGDVLIRQEKLDEAETMLTELASVYPESADTLYYLGVVYDLTERSVEARKMWRQARLIDPNHTEALRSLASWGE